ncbi:MAG: hypothetical protein CVU19_11770 [Betaproteobacteria bacterium HGW-Betaproteobacteria-13]|uniref:Uncharacterized protein n=1 Tax=Parazoarcus communis TaxID=41977 RepID=A0A2U8H3C5_9RHOO|nr:hypothetical protein [Parazoarcus communis]AWI80457.1 hypothetical protein CEW87_14465 [Parazoarcus communis]PKO80551.1 MAG: hypothetical protein CVU19_11770 [Betaproteobacteria bacterium HGW-Betaproteobacteria-13]
MSAAPFSILDGLAPPPRVSTCRVRWRVLPRAALVTLGFVLLALAFRLGMIYMASGSEGRVSPAGGAAAADRMVSAVVGVAASDGCGAPVPAGGAVVVDATAACVAARAYGPQSLTVDGGAATIRVLPATQGGDDRLLPDASGGSALQAAVATENGSATKGARQSAEQKRREAKKADKKAGNKTMARAATSRRDHDVDIIAAIVEATKPAP